MNQLEIQFFWPLTEQILLDLDHSNCYNPKISGTFLCQPGGSYVLTNGATTSTFHVDGKVSMNVDEITFRTSKKPNIFRRMLFNVLGIKLEKK